MSVPQTIHTVRSSRRIPKSKSSCCLKAVKTIEGADYGWCSQCRNPQSIETEKPQYEPQNEPKKLSKEQMLKGITREVKGIK